ncbi:hypothetical protein [Pseudorhodoplanes sp.]|uniref:COG3904 family protein n=1 Tax=Pseudorhodoplanes sp. TaxID=1934341 RepID=UPI002BB87E0C|nr:hypothetical protein [Pseudorhodoplanes sp.]HWV52273.1 hypothetical protein [Pseudorhodoplanes sp.]
MMARITLTAILACAASLAAGLDAPAQTPVSRKSELQSKLARQPLTFFLARGPEDSCGPGCREWIAADGQFDEGSAARFRVFLARTKAKDIPIFFNSNGGLQEEAMAIGRIMRERRMRAGIAVTRPELCMRKPNETAVCETAKKSGKPLASEWTSFDANCNSACGIALVGAAERWIPPGGAIGIHSPAYYCFLRSGRIVGQKGNSMLASQCRKFTAQGAAQLASYVREMGIDAGFIEAMNKVPHNEVRYLTREELVAFGIDKDEIAQTPWMGKPGMEQVTLKVLLEATGADGGKRMGWLELQCAPGDASSIVLVRPAVGGDEGAGTEVVLTAGERKFVFLPKDMSTHKNPTEPAAPYLRRRVAVPTPEIAMLAAQPEMDLRITLNPGGPEAKTQVTRISNAGLQQRWKSVAESCGK